MRHNRVVLGFEITDARHHLWEPRSEYPWLLGASDATYAGDISALQRDYGMSDYFKDRGGLPITKSVHVQANASDCVSETQRLQAIAGVNGFPHGIVAYAPLQDSHVEKILEEQMAFENVRGIRQILNEHDDPRYSYGTPPGLMMSSQWRRGFSLLESLNLSFDLQVYASQLMDAAKLAAEFPSTAIILNHAGMPIERSAESFDGWSRGMSLLSQFPNVSVKISGFGMFDHHWTVASIRPFVEKTIELFGSDRAMFASNFPNDGVYSTMEAVFGAFDEITAGYSLTERQALFGGNANRIYRV